MNEKNTSKKILEDKMNEPEHLNKNELEQALKKALKKQESWIFNYDFWKNDDNCLKRVMAWDDKSFGFLFLILWWIAIPIVIILLPFFLAKMLWFKSRVRKANKKVLAIKKSLQLFE